ncbi:hypothetical protein [Amycolatopsis rubida]|uniref:Uncharacterized protein n=1 Tax=Amycolatopsis rubida TaxID=112413 RepID=A0A1I5IHX9_9PSEU|nr:hypothetical protein [Amycolatopsis rubida]SFO60155.1 hypothetical protein SAMN05421854_102480 [Amycolatopsis rubida]
MTDYKIDFPDRSIATDVFMVTTVTPVPRETMLAFVQAHGIDPNDVPVPSTVTVDDGQITFERFVFDDNRKILFEGDEGIRERKTVPLQAPWPPRVDECAEHGHDWHRITPGTPGLPEAFRCTRCPEQEVRDAS